MPVAANKSIESVVQRTMARLESDDREPALRNLSNPEKELKKSRISAQVGTHPNMVRAFEVYRQLAKFVWRC
jgi:hypothetical protein